MLHPTQHYTTTYKKVFSRREMLLLFAKEVFIDQQNSAS